MEDWHVAESDPEAALITARNAAQLPFHITALVISPLSGADIARLGLAAGTRGKQTIDRNDCRIDSLAIAGPLHPVANVP
jgi:hypothetical protein